MRSKADETFVIVETLICPLQISDSVYISSVFAMSHEICLMNKSHIL